MKTPDNAKAHNDLKYFQIVTLDDYGFFEKHFVSAQSSSQALQDVMTTKDYLGGSSQIISLVEMPDT